MDLGQGDEVICVDATPRKTAESLIMCSILKVGAKYRIRQIIKEGPERGVYLEGIFWPFKTGYYHDRFRKIEKKGDTTKVSDEVKDYKRWMEELTRSIPELGQKIKKPEKVE